MLETVIDCVWILQVMFYTAGQAEALHDMKGYGFTVTHSFSWPYDTTMHCSDCSIKKLTITNCLLLWVFSVIKKARDDYIKRLNDSYDRGLNKVADRCTHYIVYPSILMILYIE